MDLEISGRHVDISDRMREHTLDKLSRIDKFADQVLRVNVTYFKDADDKVAEILAHIRRGKDAVAEARAETFYKALDLAVDKIERQLTRAKERVKEHRGRPKPEPLGPASGEPVEGEEFPEE